MVDDAQPASGGLVPGPQPGDLPLYRNIDTCMLGHLLASASPGPGIEFHLPEDPTWAATVLADGTWRLSKFRGKRYEREENTDG